jgi:hypothetical protein
MMMSKGNVLLTAEDLLRWREEDKKLDEEIRQRQQRRNELKRKLDAAEVFAEPLSDASSDNDPPPNSPDADAGGESPPQALHANLLKTGESLNVKQIKARLIELGFGERLKAQPNYHYQLVYRLTKGDKLLRRGTRYRAAPISSSKEEAEGVGPSASQ